MDDDGARHGRVGARGRAGAVVRGAVLEVEALGELEVELDRRALERAAERVADLDVDLGPVERTVAGVELPLAGVVRVERLLQLLWGGQYKDGGKRGRRRTSSASFQVLMSPR